MSFHEKWAALENNFQQRVQADNEELGIQSSYVHNFVPGGPVDYILIAMEPSTGVPVAGAQQSAPTYQIDRNFTWSVEDFVLHYCIRQYLCEDGEAYHLTDLAKGGMTTKLAEQQRQRRYKNWYPLLRKELQLLNKPGQTRIIAVGKVVQDFLKDRDLSAKSERVLHYTRTAARYRPKEVPQSFIESVNEHAFKESIKQVLCEAGMDSYIGRRPENGKCIQLTESRKKLMFHYKNRFTELRRASNIVLRLDDEPN